MKRDRQLLFLLTMRVLLSKRAFAGVRVSAARVSRTAENESNFYYYLLPNSNNLAGSKSAKEPAHAELS